MRSVGKFKGSAAHAPNAGELIKDEFKRGIIRLSADLFQFDGTRYRLHREENGRTVFYHNCVPRREGGDAVFDLDLVYASYFMNGAT